MSKTFTEIDLLRLEGDDDVGLVAPITAREKSPGHVVLSFAIMKEFERGAITERTSYLNQRHIDAARKLLDMVEERLMLEKERIIARRRQAATVIR
jgi:hypothetical protein